MCIFFHKWHGCTCQDCGLTRSTDHNWQGCICQQCGTKRDQDHTWKEDASGCTCSICGIVKDHSWKGCVCVNCGMVRNKFHAWENSNDLFKCTHCGKTLNALECLTSQLRENIIDRRIAIPIIEKIAELHDELSINVLLDILDSPGADHTYGLLSDSVKKAILAIGRASIPYLRHALHDRSMNGQGMALYLLLEIDGIAAKDDFISSLENKKLYSAAASALAQLNCVEAFPALLKTIEKEHPMDDYNFATAFCSLAKATGVAAVRPLLNILERENGNSILVREIIDTLISIGNPEAFLPILFYFKNNVPHDEYNNTSKFEQAFLKFARQEDTQYFIEMLSYSPNTAIRCLKVIGDARSILPLLKIAQNESVSISRLAERGVNIDTYVAINSDKAKYFTGAGSTLLDMLTILEREIKHVDESVLKAIVDMEQIVTSAYFENIYEYGGRTDYYIVNTDYITSIAYNELYRRESA